jgi:hypothetical protein
MPWAFDMPGGGDFTSCTGGEYQSNKLIIEDIDVSFDDFSNLSFL